MSSISQGQTLESMSQAVWYNQWTLGKFAKYLKGNILEIGCGIGNFTKTLTNYGQIWSIDIEENFLNQNKKLIGDKARVGFGDIEKGNYFFNNQKFDVVVCLNVLEHIRDDDKALKNLNALLKIRGLLILLVPSDQFLSGEIDKSIGHFRRYTKSEIINKLKNQGFKIWTSRRINFLGAIGWFISGKIFKQRTVDEGKIKLFNFIAPLVLPLENIIEPPVGTSILVIASKI